MSRSDRATSSRRAGLAAAGALLIGLLAVGPAAHADGNGASSGGDNGYNGLGQHVHKVEHPTIEGSRNRTPQPAGGRATTNQLRYGGGVNGIGVTTGAPKVYLVFWGAGWGAAGSDGTNVTLTGDTKGAAPLLQRFFRGLGTNNELWSGVMTQYCNDVAAGATTCTAAAPRVGYPGSGSTLAGVWVDPSTTAIKSSGSTPTSPVDHDLAAEAILAAANFGNTTPDSNRSAQYVIVSPPGTHPGGFNTPSANWCAWHDYNGDTTLIGGAASSPYGSIAFTNMPYVTDLGASCGQSYVNAGAAGTLDGFTIVEGHEYAETITDQNPAGGWTDPTGAENADKCSWIGTGGAGGAQNVTLTSGRFAVQGTWSNDGATCLVSHAVVTASTNDFSLSATPASLTIAPGGTGSATISTAVTNGGQITVDLSATGGPAGTTTTFAPSSITTGGAATLTVNVPSTATAGTYTLTVTASGTGVSHTTTVSISVPGVVNGGFETGSFTGWSRSGTTSLTTSAHTGRYAALLGTTRRTNGDSSVTQSFVAGINGGSLYYKMRCGQGGGVDWATVTLVDAANPGSPTTLLPKTCVTSTGWVPVGLGLIAGHSYTLTLTNHDNNSSQSGAYTYTQFDDVVG